MRGVVGFVTRWKAGCRDGTACPHSSWSTDRLGVMMMLYYDRRVRTEALDLQVAAERLGQPVGV